MSALAETTVTAYTRQTLRLSSGLHVQLYHWGQRGPLVLLHHGSGFCAGTLRAVADALADHYRVVAFDARGHGDSDKPERGYHWQAFAGDLDEVARHVLQRYAEARIGLAVGHSFGATLFMSVAQRSPSLFGALFLMEPVLLSVQDYALQQRPDGTTRLSLVTRMRQAHFASAEHARERLAQSALFQSWHPQALEDYLSSGFEWGADGSLQLKCPPAIEAQLFEMGPSDGVLSSARIESPTWLEQAQHGWFRPRHYDAYRSLFRDLTMVMTDGCHCIPMHAPAATSERIRAFGAALGY